MANLGYVSARSSSLANLNYLLVWYFVRFEVSATLFDVLFCCFRNFRGIYYQTHSEANQTSKTELFAKIVKV